MLRSIVLRALLACVIAFGFVQEAMATYIVTSVSSNNPAVAPATVTISTNAYYDDDGIRLSGVYIFHNGTLVASGWDSASATVGGLAAGTHEFVAQAVNEQGGGASESYSVTVLSPPPTVSMSSNGTSFIAPAAIGLSANASDTDGTVSKVEFFANGGLIGTDTSAPYAMTWSNVPAGSYSVTAKATDNYGASTTTSATSISVRNPIPNAQYVGQTVAALMQPGATQVVSVQMKNNGETTWSNATSHRLGSQNPHDNWTWGLSRVGVPSDVSPGQTTTFNFTITAPTAPGLYNFQWKMLQEGVTWFGDATANVAIRVNALPGLTLHAPSGAPFTAPASVGLSASAADSDGSVTKVEFYANGALIGTDTVSPYAMTWSGVTAGAHTVIAKAYDNTGAVVTSGSISVSVNNAVPTVALGTPTGTPFIAPATVGLSATASDPDGTIARVEFYAGSTLLSTDTTAPYTYSWGNVAAGSYSVTARAYDNTGAFTTSTAAAVNVSQTTVIGNVDQVRQFGKEYRILGWACSTGRNQSISVHLYAGGAAGSGSYAGASTANLASEPAVAQACQSQGAAYRFQIPLTAAIRSQHGGKKIYIHGISPDGLPNLLIGNSGVLAIPAPLAITRRYVYDDKEQLCKVIEPETGATVMQYDGAGNPVWSASGLSLADANNCNRDEAWASSRVVLRDYDSRNRLTTLSFPDHNGDQTWTYFADGKVKDITTLNDGGTTSVINAYAYKNRGLLKGETQSQPSWYSWSIGYGYDPNGSLATVLYPTQLSVDYAPNALGQATKAGNYASGVQYYPNGAIKQFTYGNGVVHTMVQNGRGIPSRSTDSGGALDHEYAYDRNGNVTRIEDYAQGSHYTRVMTYDDLDRLSTAAAGVFGGDGVHRFSYDSVDNLRAWTLAGVKDYASYYYEPGTNRLTNIQNSAGTSIVGMGYDPQGNLQNKNGQGYVFDYGNRLREVTGKESYRYDAHGRRVETIRNNGELQLFQYSQEGQYLFGWKKTPASVESTLENVYLGGSLVATIDHAWPSNAITAVKYQHTDALGSPVAVTNESGQVAERTNYDPFGAAINKTVDGVGYTGHVMDAATGLTYMQQRYYDPSIGRFLSVDPVTALDGGQLHFNRYNYAYNNPYKFTDPDGRCPMCIPVIIFIAKELAGEAFEQATGLPAPTVKGLGKRAVREIAERGARRTLAQRAADRARNLPSSQRPNTVSAIKHPNGTVTVGRNQGGSQNPKVQSAVDNAPQNCFGGQCAEVNAAARAANKGRPLEGSEISTANVRGPESTTGVHGTVKPQCETCQSVTSQLGIKNADKPGK